MQAVLCVVLAFGCRGVLKRATPMQAVLCIGLAIGCRGALKRAKPMQVVLKTLSFFRHALSKTNVSNYHFYGL
jgi:hypothetical protein